MTNNTNIQKVASVSGNNTTYTMSVSGSGPDEMWIIEQHWTNSVESKTTHYERQTAPKFSRVMETFKIWLEVSVKHSFLTQSQADSALAQVEEFCGKT